MYFTENDQCPKQAWLISFGLLVKKKVKGSSMLIVKCILDVIDKISNHNYVFPLCVQSTKFISLVVIEFDL